MRIETKTKETTLDCGYIVDILWQRGAVDRAAPCMSEWARKVPGRRGRC